MAETKKLEDHSVIYLAGRIDEKKTEDTARKLLEMNFSDQSEPIQLIINSPGGNLEDTFALLDIIRWSRRPVRTTGIGVIASGGLMLFMAGEKGHRVLTPTATIMSHRYTWAAFGNYSDLVAHRKEQDLTHARVVEHYKRCTKLKTEKELDKHLLRDVDTWLSAREAVALGIADRIEHAGVSKTAMSSTARPSKGR